MNGYGGYFFVPQADEVVVARRMAKRRLSVCWPVQYSFPYLSIKAMKGMPCNATA